MDIKKEILKSTIGATCNLAIALLIDAGSSLIKKKIKKKGAAKRMEKINKIIESEDYGPEIVKKKRSPLTVAEFKNSLKEES